MQLKDALLRAKDVIGQQRAVRKRPSDQSTSSAEGEPAAAAAAHEQKRRRKLGGSQGKAAGFTASPDRAESAASQALAEAQEVEPSVQVRLCHLGHAPGLMLTSSPPIDAAQTAQRAL